MSYPTNPVSVCLKCGNRHSQVKVCKGEGQYAENYNRRYSMCLTCRDFVWYDPPTPISQIPPHVLHAISNLQKAKATPGALECANEGCTTSNGKRRDANKLCTRNGSGPLCKQCCVALGGCRVHAAGGVSFHTAGVAAGPASTVMPSVINPADITLHQLLSQFPPPTLTPPATQPAHSGPASSQTASIVEARPPTKRSYAQPFDEEGYGQLARTAQSQAHRERQARAERHAKEKEVMMQRNSKQQVKVWFEPSEKPKTLQVVLPIYGVLVPSEHSPILRLLGSSCAYIEVFTLGPVASSEFILQEINVPVDTFPGVPTLLLKDGLKPEQCPGLDEAIARVIEDTQHLLSRRGLNDLHRKANKASSSPRSLEKRRMRSNSPTSSSSSLPPSSPSRKSLSSLSSFTISTKKVAPPKASIPFPLEYACEMTKGFEHMLSLLDRSRGSVESNFAMCWPHCKFIKSTYYKQEHVYKKAKRSRILSRFVDAGRTEQGSWSALATAVESEDDAELSNSSDVPQPHIPDSSLDHVVYDFQNVRVEHFRIEPNLVDVSAWCENDIYRPAAIMEGPTQTGSKMEIYHIILSWRHNQKEQDCVLKKVALPGDWWIPAPNEDVGYLAQGMELWHSYVLMEEFTTAVDNARESGANWTVSIKHAPTAFVSTESGPLGLVQPFIEGLHFTRQSLLDQRNTLAADTVDAFSHFVYEKTDGLKVITDLQGKMTPEGGLVVFDGCSHTKTTEVEYQTIRRYSLGNRGDLGIERFCKSHLCNIACLTLGLKRLEEIGK
ncbi:hypothetical protein D9613_003185 [Agrocybe pediades]|uniref:Alpha-type protein kinase domain-containing protein n=1 Tax=Agrocybe pediades TaxID=84607 RepID=A0A8H4QPA3_9AGAR|nr:hypothetical protein D9613_003185 [Agrocybe pediades]